MEVNKLSIFKINNKNNDNNSHVKRFGVSCPNLAPLKQDTVSFKGNVLKKSDFKGVDLAVVERYKPNIQQFKSKEDLQAFAENKIKELFINPENFQDGKTLKQLQGDNLKDFGGRQEETKVQRKAMLKEWFDYVIKENDAYSNTQRLVILSAITKDLKSNNDTIPPVLNKGVLADTISDLEAKLKNNPKENFDFNKMYQNNLRTSFMKDTSTGETMTGWVVIPSKENDPKNFEKNVEKLKTLSHNNWCTKSFNAEPYLSQGDFHVYLENGEPKLGVRFVGNEVQEIQGEKNNGKIPVKYLDVFLKYQEVNNFLTNTCSQSQIHTALRAKQEIEELKRTIDININGISGVIKLFEYFNKKPQVLENGLLSISDYIMHNNNCITLSDLDISEDQLFKYISEIRGFASFSDSEVTNLGNLESIKGDAFFAWSNNINLGKLKKIDGSLSLSSSKIKDLRELEYVGRDADFENSNIQSLGKLKTINGNASFLDSKLESLGVLEKIGGCANFRYSIVKDLGNLKLVGKNVYLGKSKLKTFDFQKAKVCVGHRIRTNNH